MAEPFDVFEVDGRPGINWDAVAWGHRVARATQVGWQLGIFQALVPGALTAEAVADRCGTHAETTEKLMVVLAALGLLYRHPNGEFRLTDEGRAAFDPESPLFYGDGLEHARLTVERWHALDDYVRTGRMGGGPPSGDGHQAFVGAMHDYAMRGRARWLAGNVDLAGRRLLLDLGGGPGSYSIALCQRYADLAAVVFDQPQTEPICRDKVARFGLSERIAFKAGDWGRDDYGSGYDCALLSNVLHGAGRGCEDRLARVHAALVPGATLVVQDFLMDDDRNGPLPAAVFYLHVGAYTVGEMLAVIEQAGFAQATLRSMGQTGNGLVTAVRP